MKRGQNSELFSNKFRENLMSFINDKYALTCHNCRSNTQEVPPIVYIDMNKDAQSISVTDVPSSENKRNVLDFVPAGGFIR